MREADADLAVIGGGPAGLAAATAAAECGARVALLDAFERPGGQYTMQPPPRQPAASSRQARLGAEAVAAAERAGVRLFSGRSVWAVYPGFGIAASGAEGGLVLRARALVSAGGAQDRLLPFPGWTLPGVMTPGAGQRLAKLSGVPAGRRVVLAGSGPFLLAVAASLLKAGGGLAAYVEAGRPRPGWLAHLLRHPAQWGEAGRLLLPLATSGASRFFGHCVVEALGEGRLEAVRIAPLDAGGRPLLDRSRILEDVDALLVGYGFRPQVEVTMLLGAGHRFDEASGGWSVETDPQTGATSVPGLFAAGEVSGVAGYRPAVAGGRIAGLGAADYLGFGESRDRRRRLARGLAGARRFADGLNRLFPPPADLSALLHDDTLVCRCEDVTAGSIRAALGEGAQRNGGAVKLWTRAGMGPCQGRICGWAIARLVARETGRTLESVGVNAPRIPLQPVPLTEVEACMRLLESGPAAEPGKGSLHG